MAKRRESPWRQLKRRLRLKRQSRDLRVEPLERRELLAFDTTIVNVPGQSTSVFLAPPDTVGDVGPNHYIQMVNAPGGSTFEIYDKQGNVVQASRDVDTLAAPGSNCANGAGDPIVLYDHLADRWLVSEFTPPGVDAMCVYISQTPDPTAGSWFAYEIVAPNFPDYLKIAAWEDAYTIGTNEVDNPIYALDRQRLVNGPSGVITAIRQSTPDRPGWQRNQIMPVDLDGPPAPAGSPSMFVRQIDDEITNPGGADPTQDFVEVWELDADFVTPANSTYTLAATVGIADFDYTLCNFSRFCLDQPGNPNSLDALPHYIHYSPQYRNFGSYETIVGSFTEDVDTDHAGIHWFEMRRTPGGNWTLYQDGTYAPDTQDRWMGSIAMNADGDIALGFSITSSTTTSTKLRAS